MKQKRILKRHIGRSLDWRGAEWQIINGHIVKVQNGIAAVNYWVAEHAGTFTHYMPVNGPQIVEVY